MLALDIVSIFLKLNDTYKKTYNINKSIIARKMLSEIFYIADSELEPISVIFSKYVPIIKYEYARDFQ
jgi:hypothetical protein